VKKGCKFVGLPIADFALMIQDFEGDRFIESYSHRLKTVANA
jgi:hypothetical protein